MENKVRQKVTAISIGMLGAIVLTLGAGIIACIKPPGNPGWMEAFGYRKEEVHSLEIRESFPYIPLRIGASPLWLLFDTGNMVGLSVSSERFDQLGLRAEGHYNRVNSAGKTVGILRVADAVDVSVFDRDVGPTRIYELDHPSLPGLAGPSLIGGRHFTLDYRSRKIAVGTRSLPDSVPGFRRISLVRSGRHPLLILVRGTVEGRAVLLELDTGKSRTVINPGLASELGLRRDSGGAAIQSVRIGDLVFEVPSAKEVDQTSIDPLLPEPILAGVGSDLLSSFVWTVDYEAGVLWIPAAR